MTWSRYHSASEILASAAELELRRGNKQKAEDLYKSAAEAEELALLKVDQAKSRTLGVTAVSAAALYFKAGDLQKARSIAQQWLKRDSLPSFALEQLKSIAEEAGPVSAKVKPEVSKSKSFWPRFRWWVPLPSYLTGISACIYLPVLFFRFASSQEARQLMAPDMDFGAAYTPRVSIALALGIAALCLIFLERLGELIACFLFASILFLFASWAQSTSAIKQITGLAVLPNEGFIGNIWIGGRGLDVMILLVTFCLFTFTLYLVWRRYYVSKIRGFFTQS